MYIKTGQMLNDTSKKKEPPLPEKFDNHYASYDQQVLLKRMDDIVLYGNNVYAHSIQVDKLKC